MVKKTLLGAYCAGLLALTAFAAPPASSEASKLKCSLTGKVVEKCCCVDKDGKTHCTLADKDIERCCCKPAQEKKAE